MRGMTIDHDAYDYLNKKSPVYSLSDFSEHPAHWLGGFKSPTLALLHQAPVGANAVSILTNQYLENSSMCFSAVVACLFLI